MITTALFGEHTLQLYRFPLEQKNRSLQAWDSADEYLIDYVIKNNNNYGRVLILNDAFGALCCALLKLDTDTHIINVTDSYVSHQACVYNCEQNDLSISNIQFLDSLSALPNNVDLVLIKMPKNAGYLQHQLALLSHFEKEIPVIVAGKVKDIHTSTLKSVGHFLSEPTTSLAVKKSRLIFSSTTNKPVKSKYPSVWSLENTSFKISNHANVFSRDSLDIGARFFSNYLPKGKKPLKIIDLGCGNGVIGLQTLAAMPSAKITFVDESFMAVASAKENVEANLQSRLDDCMFVQNDCLSGFHENNYDLILCNPPFHQAQAITDHIAWQMFMQAKNTLCRGGELRIIGNRHLDYHDKLNRLFGNCKVIASNKKFTVLSSIKRG